MRISAAVSILPVEQSSLNKRRVRELLALSAAGQPVLTAWRFRRAVRSRSTLTRSHEHELVRVRRTGSPDRAPRPPRIPASVARTPTSVMYRWVSIAPIRGPVRAVRNRMASAGPGRGCAAARRFRRLRPDGEGQAVGVVDDQRGAREPVEQPLHARGDPRRHDVRAWRGAPRRPGVGGPPARLVDVRAAAATARGLLADGAVRPLRTLAAMALDDRCDHRAVGTCGHVALPGPPRQRPGGRHRHVRLDQCMDLRP